MQKEKPELCPAFLNTGIFSCQSYFDSVFDSNFFIASLINWYEMIISTGQLSIHNIGSVYIVQLKILKLKM